MIIIVEEQDENILKGSIIVIILILFLTVCLMITLPPQLSDLVGGTAWASLVPGLQRALGDQDPQVSRDRGILFFYIIANTFLRHLKVVFSRSSTLRWRVSALLFTPGFWSLDPTSQ